MGLQALVDQRVEAGDHTVMMREQLAQRVEAPGVGLWELEAVELGGAEGSPTVHPRPGIPFLAMTPWI